MSEFLGKPVKDLSSNITGLCIYSSQLLSGSLRYGVQPYSITNDAKIPEGFEVDGELLELVSGDDYKEIEVIRPNEHPFSIGDRVSNVIQGYTGVITAIVNHVNGCVQATVRVKPGLKSVIRGDLKYPLKTSYVQELRMVKPGIILSKDEKEANKKIKELKAKIEDKDTRKTGGPRTMAVSR